MKTHKNPEFRCRSKKSQEWKYFDLKQDLLANNEPSDLLKDDMDPETLGQYTGLKDKDGLGVKVYVGDIFPVILGADINRYVINVPVILHKGMFVLRFTHPEIDKPTFTALHQFLKNSKKVVIGNVYDNPELICPTLAQA